MLEVCFWQLIEKVSSEIVQNERKQFLLLKKYEKNSLAFEGATNRVCIQNWIIEFDKTIGNWVTESMQM